MWAFHCLSVRSTAAPDQWPNALRSIQNKSVLRGGSDRASGSFSAPGRQTAELVVDVPAALQTVQRLGPQVRPNSINDRHHCATMRLLH